MNKIAVSYEFNRLCFKRDLIEPLAEHDYFKVITPQHIFLMSKMEFHQTFPNVLASHSYKNTGIYHYPTVPKKAHKYIVGHKIGIG